MAFDGKIRRLVPTASHHANCSSSSNTAPVGPSLPSCASRIMITAPSSGVRLPRKPWKSVATCPGAAPFTFVDVPVKVLA